jgi:tellurite resistance protein
MLGFLKAKFDASLAEWSKFSDKETAEAVVAIMCGTSYADGELQASEKEKFTKALSISPILKQFDKSILIAKWNELATQLEFDIDVGIEACIKELQDVVRKGSSEEKRIAILRMGVAAAKSSGEIDPAERAFLANAASTLGVALSQIGL